MPETLSTASLIKSTVISLVIAICALVTIILPAEYNIDPTGIGKLLGLTALANTPHSPAKSDTVQNNNEHTINENATVLTDSITVEVPADRGIEYKFYMKQYQKMEYEWVTDGEPLYFDLHGEPEGDTTGYFESYAITTSNQMKGSFTAPFAGSHGWYWKNTSRQPVNITLNVKGNYTLIGLKQ
ncbi:hypothetical protein [Flocculibacter collagenilyticus]|uniref:hypothetical protein n=1 Tax=Flocculibacter collagenilyticus TaxID=2744479 RepID=UPI0018F39863|nr:hypothetical protein [Flocculibacter collagenilyticus]